MKRFNWCASAMALCACALLATAEDKTKLQQDPKVAGKPVPANTHHASDIIGMNLLNRSGEKLGAVRDLAFEPSSGKLSYVVVASGGILGLGADYHAVPPKALALNTTDTKSLTIGMSKEQWDTSPKFKKDQLSNLDAHRESIEKHFAQAKSDEDFKAEAKIGDAKAEIKIKAPEIPSPTGRSDSKGASLHLATDLIGKQVVNQQNEALGKVSDLLVSLEDAKVAFAIVSTGTVLKPGGDRYAVAVQNLTLAGKDKVTLNVDRAALQDAPVFDPDKWETSGKTSGSAGVFKYEQRAGRVEVDVEAKDKQGASVEVKTSDGDSPTALSLAREANRYVGEQAKDKLVQLRSEKSVNGVTPTVWYVVFYDSTAALKATEVKFVNGKMVDVKRPMRLLEATSDKSQPLDREKIKFDSDKALQAALKDPSLAGAKPTASEMRLERGEGALPVWRVKLWAAKAADATDETSLGELTLSAEDGKLIKSDLKNQ